MVIKAIIFLILFQELVDKKKIRRKTNEAKFIRQVHKSVHLRNKKKRHEIYEQVLKIRYATGCAYERITKVLERHYKLCQQNVASKYKLDGR